jgi:Domain of unknown function (DUF6916)
MLEILHKESFAECLQTDFQVIQPGAAAFALKLTKVIEQVKSPRQEAFSVLFHGPADRFIGQGTYKLRNEKMGQLEIFLVPIARDNDGFQYEAVFNHLLQPRQG